MIDTVPKQNYNSTESSFTTSRGLLVTPGNTFRRRQTAFLRLRRQAIDLLDQSVTAAAMELLESLR